MADTRKVLEIHLTNAGTLRFIFEPGVEEMIEQQQLHELIGDVIAEFGENYRFKNRTHVDDLKGKVGSGIIIPKGATF